METIGVHRMVCAVDLNEEGVNVLRYANKLAHETGAAIRIVHALPPVRPTDLVGADEDLLEGLREAVRADIGRMMERAGLRAPVELEFGEVPQVIRCAAKRHHADLVVVGRKQEHPHGGFLRAHGYAIVREAPCPVLSL
jgi:nucleotide-binding universal stress UspA family protein